MFGESGKFAVQRTSKTLQTVCSWLACSSVRKCDVTIAGPAFAAGLAQPRPPPLSAAPRVDAAALDFQQLRAFSARRGRTIRRLRAAAAESRLPTCSPIPICKASLGSLVCVGKASLYTQ